MFRDPVSVLLPPRVYSKLLAMHINLSALSNRKNVLGEKYFHVASSIANNYCQRWSRDIQFVPKDTFLIMFTTTQISSHEWLLNLNRVTSSSYVYMGFLSHKLCGCRLTLDDNLWTKSFGFSLFPTPHTSRMVLGKLRLQKSRWDRWGIKIQGLVIEKFHDDFQ